MTMARRMAFKLPARLLGLPVRAESVARNILLFGFFVLLLLVAGIGYWSQQSLVRVQEEVGRIRDSEENHISLVLRIENMADQMAAEARNALATSEDTLLHFPARQRLKQLRNEMDAHLVEGRKSSMYSTEEWKAFESSYDAYWAAINSDQPVDWLPHRERLTEAINSLKQWTENEHEENNRRTLAEGEKARKRVLRVTFAGLGVGLIVAGLTFYEIRRNLIELGAAYRESAESSDYLRSLLDSLVSGIVVIDSDGTLLTISRSFQNLTGLGGESDLGRGYEELFGAKPALAAGVKKELESESEKGRYFGRVELGEGRLFDVFASPLMISGERRGLILVFLDITETEKARSELRRNRALTAVGQMTAQIAHEIKNPLGSISFATEMLKRQPAAGNGKNDETIGVIERSVSHLKAIVNELNEFARPKELDRTETNLNHLLDELVPMVADRLNQKQVTINKDYSGEIPVGRYDTTELKKLFLNLIINAIDASQPGSAIELRTRATAADAVAVDVIDQGTGMDEETLGRLFEPFYTTKSQGTGLGMAIAKKIAELHRGDLTVASRRGQGTRVTVKLPVE